MSALATAIDLVLPGDGDFPPGSALDLAARLSSHPHFSPSIAAFAELLPPDLKAGEAGTAVLRSIEAASPDIFAAMLTGAYSLYYSDPQVLAVVARTTGYTPRAPQPDGYDLPPFDPAVLSVVAGRAPHYRKVTGDDHGK